MKTALTHIFSFFMFFAFVLPVCAAENPEVLYQKAATAYKSNSFEEGQKLYEQLITNGYTTTEVYYNLANCYFKMNQLGKAILNYERALRLSPKDEDIAYNLQFAELKTIDKIQPVPQLAIVTGWKNFVGSTSYNGWATLSAIFIWIALALAALYFFVSRNKILSAAGVVFAILSVATLLLGILQHRQTHDSSCAILLTESASALSAPDAASGAVFNLHEGVKLLILDEVSGWHKIRLEDGRVGWLPTGTFERI